MKIPELLAPAGDPVCLKAALDAGANAVYLGLDVLNMRSSSKNFSLEELKNASMLCKERGVKIHLALNTLVFQNELALAEKTLASAKPFIDAAIVADWGVVAICKKLGIPFHISTQMSCANLAAARFMTEQGASRIVLARECSLAEIEEIARECGSEIEVFAHGAQCVAESGRCWLSHEAYGCSGNRGECKQPCRREYLVQEFDRYGNKEGDAKFVVTPHQIFSAKDLCSLPFLPKLLACAVASLKVEGRGRNPEYVKTVVSAYRTALDAIADETFSSELCEELVAKCRGVFNRGFGCGLFHGRPGVDQFTDGTDGNQAGRVKEYCGYVLNYYERAKICQAYIQSAPLLAGDEIQIHGPTTGVAELTVAELRRDDERLSICGKGEWCTFPCPQRVREHDKVYRIKKN